MRGSVTFPPYVCSVCNGSLVHTSGLVMNGLFIHHHGGKRLDGIWLSYDWLRWSEPDAIYDKVDDWAEEFHAKRIALAIPILVGELGE